MGAVATDPVVGPDIFRTTGTCWNTDRGEASPAFCQASVRGADYLSGEISSDRGSLSLGLTAQRGLGTGRQSPFSRTTKRVTGVVAIDRAPAVPKGPFQEFSSRGPPCRMVCPPPNGDTVITQSCKCANRPGELHRQLCDLQKGNNTAGVELPSAWLWGS